MMLTTGVPVSNAPVALVFQSNDNMVPTQRMGNLLVNQNLDESINPNTYVKRVLAEFRQQLTGQIPMIMVMS